LPSRSQCSQRACTAPASMACNARSFSVMTVIRKMSYFMLFTNHQAGTNIPRKDTASQSQGSERAALKKVRIMIADQVSASMSMTEAHTRRKGPKLRFSEHDRWDDNVASLLHVAFQRAYSRVAHSAGGSLMLDVT